MSTTDSPSKGLPPEVLSQLFPEQSLRFQLPNGLTVVHREDVNNPLVSVQVWVKTGSIHEEKCLGAGVSHFLEHMLFKGTPRRPGCSISAEVQAFGGHINAYTAFDRTVYFIDAPSESFAQVMDILADITLNAQIPASEIEKEKSVILREIEMANDDPERDLTRSTLATAFRIHPYRYPVIGLRSLFESSQREDLASYYHQRYIPSNMVLVVAGNVPEHLLREVLEKTFAPAARHALLPIFVPAEPEQLSMRELRKFGDVQVSRGALAFRIPSLRHPDAPALDLLSAILCGGYSALLRQRLRDELGLVHHIDATSWNPGDSGLFWIQYACDPDKTASAENGILRELELIAQQGLSPDSLDKARRFALVAEIQGRQTVSGMASRLGLAEAIVGDLNYAQTYFARINRLDINDINSLFKRYLTTERMTAVTVIPQTAETPKNRTRSKPAPQLPDFQLHTLSNGARLLLQPDHRLPRTHLRYTALGGPLYEEPAERGITSLLVNLMTKDTRFRRAADIAALLESRGGFMSESSGNNTFAISVEVLPSDLDLGLQLLEEAVLFPAFRNDTFEREKKAQIAAIQEELDDIVDYGRKALRRNFFGLHPFGSDPIGESFSLENLTVRQIQAQYSKLVVGPNSVLTVTGDFDPKAILAGFSAFMEEIPDWAFRPVLKPFHQPFQTGTIIDNLKREQAVVFEAYPDSGILAEDCLAGDILDEILSDMSGPLFMKVREDNALAYFVSASRVLGLHYGMFYLFAGTQPESVDLVYAAFDEALQQIRDEGPSEDQLRRACTKLKVGKRMQLQTAASRGASATLNLLYGKPIQDWKNLDARLDNLTTGNIRNFAIKHLDPSRKLRLQVVP